MTFAFGLGSDSPAKPNPGPFHQPTKESVSYLFRLPILGNPNGCIYEKVTREQYVTSVSMLHELLLRYGEIVPKSGKAELWILHGENADAPPAIQTLRPEYLIEFSAGPLTNSWNFKYVDPNLAGD